MYIMRKFKDGTRLFDILNDGWSRDLPIKQIHGEVNEMGYCLTYSDVDSLVELFEDRYEKHVRLEEIS